MTVQTLEELQEGTEGTPRGWKYFKLNVWNYLLYLFQFDNGVPKIGQIKIHDPEKKHTKIKYDKRKKNKQTTTTTTTKKQHNKHIAKPPNSKISI